MPEKLPTQEGCQVCGGQHNTTRHYQPLEEKDWKFDLRALLTFENPRRAEIDEAVRRVERKNSRENWSWEGLGGGAGLQTSFGDHWRRVLLYGGALAGAETLLKERLTAANQLIDLGGQNLDFISSKLGIKTYIGVNRYPDEKNEASNIRKPFSETEMGEGIEVIIRADMLDFVSRLQDDSVEFFTMNGIDRSIIDDEEYLNILLEEITRTMRSDGIVFGIHSSIFAKAQNDSRLKVVSPIADEYIAFKRNERL